MKKKVYDFFMKSVNPGGCSDDLEGLYAYGLTCGKIMKLIKILYTHQSLFMGDQVLMQLESINQFLVLQK